MTTLGIVGIIVALLIFMLLVYKGVSSFIMAPICALIVAITNSDMGLVESFYTFAEGTGQMIIQLFAVIFFGVILGKIYSESKAAASLARTLTNRFIMKRSGNAQVRIACLIMLIICGSMTLGGIDGFVLTFTTFPIAFIICEMVDIPRRFIPPMIMLNCAFMACPGAPQIDNIMMVNTLRGEGFDVTSTSGLIPGLIATAVVVILGYLTLTTFIIKAKNRGEHFDPGAVTEVHSFDNDVKLPNFFVALLPLILVFVLYSVFKLDVVIALVCGILLALITMGRYIDRKEGSLRKGILSVLNIGAGGFPHAVATVSVPSGLAQVVTQTAAFGVIVGWLASLELGPIMLGLVTVCVVVALTSAPPVALAVSLPIVVGICTAKGIAFNPHALGRVASLAATTFESLPVNGMCVLTIGLAKSTYKDSYLVMFINTCLFTLLGTFIAAGLCIAFPGLA
ncbi:MAG: GntP family permease [Lachnospiraceae bacterium]|nr:GntP family permease [Lachnospiraceae bacterium]